MPESEATVSINGGPKVPVSALKEGLRRVREKRGATKAEAKAEAGAEVGGIAADRLRSIIERIERLTEERKALASDIKDIMAEAKAAGFDAKALRQVIRIRTWEPADLEEHETLVDLYRRALGM
jgi:uncharacterized protein (UPF0335 family)